MKKNTFINISRTIIFFLIISLGIQSCASKQASNEYDEIYDDDIYSISDQPEINNAPELTDDFLGDFDPFRVKEIIVLSKSSKQMKPKELANNYLYPRSNNLELTFRNGINKVNITLTKNERTKLSDTMKLFLEQYEAKTLPRHKVNSKTAYFISTCSMTYGVASQDYIVDKCKYWTNCEIFNKRAYFLINFAPTATRTEKDYSPRIKLYLSPSQIPEFLELLDQEYLNSQVKILREKAYTY